MIRSNGGGELVHNAVEMAESARRWLQSPEIAQTAGMAARQAILPHGGASEKHARVISDLLR